MGTKPDFLDQTTYAQTRLPISLASTLIPDAYRNDEFYALESERLWATSWICVGYTQQLANVGDTILATINNQSLIITRAASDRLCGFYIVCRHRGAEILSEAGNYSFFRCPYHAWG